MSGPCTGPGVRLTGRCQWCELSSLSPLVPATVLPPLCCWHHLSLSHISNGVPGLGFPIQPCCQLHRPALQVDFPCHRVLWPEPPDCAAGQLPHTARSSPGHRDIQMISCGADKSIYFRSAQQVGVLSSWRAGGGRWSGVSAKGPASPARPQTGYTLSVPTTWRRKPPCMIWTLTSPRSMWLWPARTAT